MVKKQSGSYLKRQEKTDVGTETKTGSGIAGLEYRTDGVGNEILPADQGVSLGAELGTKAEEKAAVIAKGDMGAPYIPKQKQTPGFKEADNSILFEVNGLTIRRNSSYQIVGLTDDTAPKALRDFGTSKNPNPEVRERRRLLFDTTSNIYDTGFYEGSQCYRGIDAELIRHSVRARTEHIKIPYEQIVGEKKLEQSNFGFWDNYTVDLYEGCVWFTSDINHLFQLYIAMQSGYLVPKDQEGSPSYPNARYCIEDKNKVLNIKEKRNTDKVRAISLFSAYMGKDQQSLYYVLRWLGFDFVEGVSETQLTSEFYSYLEDQDEYDRAERFLYAITALDKDKESAVYKTYYKLDQLLNRGLLRRGPDGFVFEGIELGADLKQGAWKLENEADLSEVKYRVYALTERGGKL